MSWISFEYNSDAVRMCLRPRSNVLQRLSKSVRFLVHTHLAVWPLMWTGLVCRLTCLASFKCILYDHWTCPGSCSNMFIWGGNALGKKMCYPCVWRALDLSICRYIYLCYPANSCQPEHEVSLDTLPQKRSITWNKNTAKCLLLTHKSIGKLSLHEQGSMSMKTELLYKAKKERTIAFQCYSEFHGWRADHQTL